jgi:hypothetical protein
LTRWKHYAWSDCVKAEPTNDVFGVGRQES